MDGSPGLRAVRSLALLLVSLPYWGNGALPYCHLPFCISDEEASLIQVTGKLAQRSFAAAFSGSRVAINTTERQGEAAAFARPLIISKPQRQAEIASKVAKDASKKAAKAGELAASASTVLGAQGASAAAGAATQLVKGARRAAEALSVSSGFGKRPRTLAPKAGGVGLPHALTSSHVAADVAAWLDLSMWRKGANTIPVDVHRSGSLLSAVAVVMFALVVVAMVLIFFRLRESREFQDTIAALEHQKHEAREQNNDPLARKIQQQIEDLMPSRAQAAERSTVVDMPQVDMPQIHGAVVPPGRKFIFKIPPLLRPAPAHPQQYDVLANRNNSMKMFTIKLFRHMPNAERGVGTLRTDAVEGLTISVPAEGAEPIVLCTFATPVGRQVRCEIYKTGSGEPVHFGSLQEDSQCPVDLSVSGALAYTLFLAGSGRRLLSVVVRGNVKDRDIKIVDGMTMTDNTATTVRGDTGDAPYQVECYPGSDLILAVLLLACVDRLSVLSA